MDATQGLVTTHQVQLLRDEVGERLWQRLLDGVEKRLGEFLDGTTVEAGFLHLLRRVVVGLHTHCRQFQLVGLFHVGMYQLDAAVEDLRTTEDNIFCTYLIFLEGAISIVEPGEVHYLAVAVGEVGDDTLLASPHLEGLKAEDVALHLYKRHVARQFTDGIESAAVDVLIGIVFQQVTKGLDAQLVAEHLAAVWSYAGQILDVLLEDSQ